MSKRIREDLLKKAFVSTEQLENRKPRKEELNELFAFESPDTWSEYNYVALDIRNGDAYYVSGRWKKHGMSDDLQISPRKIDYDTVRNYCQRKEYNDLNENTWKQFIPEENLKGKIVKIDAGLLKNYKICLQGFYYEVHNGYYHTIVLLRKTSSGYRLFYAVARDWSGGICSEFDKTEQMIKDLLTDSKGHDAYDRLLSKEEIQYLQKIANRKKYTLKTKSKHIKCYQKWKHLKTWRKTKGWWEFNCLCEQLAKYGSNLSVNP